MYQVDDSPVPIIRFVREGRDVECLPGENLREIAIREGITLYGLKGQLGNCGGCGQCVTCFVGIEGGLGSQPLSPRTVVEDARLRRRPNHWRLACQTLVQHSVIVTTRPQSGQRQLENRLKEARAAALPPGPQYSSVPVQELDDEGDNA